MPPKATRTDRSFDPDTPLFASYTALSFVIAARRSREETYRDLLLAALTGEDCSLEILASALGNLPDNLPPGYRELRTFLLEVCALGDEVCNRLEEAGLGGAAGTLDVEPALHVIDEVMRGEGEDARQWLSNDDGLETLDLEVSSEIPLEDLDLEDEEGAAAGALWRGDEARALAPWIQNALAQADETELEAMFESPREPAHSRAAAPISTPVSAEGIEPAFRPAEVRRTAPVSAPRQASPWDDLEDIEQSDLTLTGTELKEFLASRHTLPPLAELTPRTAAESATTSVEAGPPASSPLNASSATVEVVGPAMAPDAALSELPALSESASGFPLEPSAAATDHSERLVATTKDQHPGVQSPDREVLELLSDAASLGDQALELLLEKVRTGASEGSSPAMAGLFRLLDHAARTRAETSTAPAVVSEAAAPPELPAQTAAMQARIEALEQELAQLDTGLERLQGHLDSLFMAEPVAWGELERGELFPRRPLILSSLARVAETVECWRMEYDHVAERAREEAARAETLLQTVESMKERVEEHKRAMLHQDKLMIERDERLEAVQQALTARTEELSRIKVLSLWNHMRFSILELKGRVQVAIAPRGLLGRRKLPQGSALKALIEQFAAIEKTHQVLTDRLSAEELALVEKDLQFLRTYAAVFKKLAAQAGPAKPRAQGKSGGGDAQTPPAPPAAPTVPEEPAESAAASA